MFYFTLAAAAAAAVLTGCPVVRRRQQPPLHGDLSQDIHERQRDIHGHRWVLLGHFFFKMITTI